MTHIECFPYASTVQSPWSRKSHSLTLQLSLEAGIIIPVLDRKLRLRELCYLVRVTEMAHAGLVCTDPKARDHVPAAFQLALLLYTPLPLIFTLLESVCRAPLPFFLGCLPLLTPYALAWMSSTSCVFCPVYTTASSEYPWPSHFFSSRLSIFFTSHFLVTHLLEKDWVSFLSSGSYIEPAPAACCLLAFWSRTPLRS